ncbi:MAG: ABC-type transport auxiliary lipoprotein family protein [Betaproteobacteria bacterium]
MKSIRPLSLAAAAAFCLTLAGCGSVPPAPVDRFYRLQPAAPATTGKVLPGAVAVLPFTADSLFAERPLVYGEETNPRQLRQYHYHLWLYAPPQAVREHLLASLGNALEFTGTEPAPYTLEGRVVRFERIVGAQGGKAAASLQLRLHAGGKVVLDRTYQAEQPAAGDSMSAFVAAMEQALAKIYADFLKDAAGRRG